MKALKMINECIEKLENMTQEEFDSIVVKKNIDSKQYDKSHYVGGEFSIVLPGEADKYDNNKFKIMEKFTYNKSDFVNSRLFSINKIIGSNWKTIDYVDCCFENIKLNTMSYVFNFPKEDTFVTTSLNDNMLNSEDNVFNKIKDDFVKAA